MQQRLWPSHGRGASRLRPDLDTLVSVTDYTGGAAFGPLLPLPLTVRRVFEAIGAERYREVVGSHV